MCVEEAQADCHRSFQIANEAKNAMTAQVVKDKLFNQPLTESLTASAAQSAVRGAWTGAAEEV